MAAFLEQIKTIKSKLHARIMVGETLVQLLRLRLRWREFTLGDLMCGNLQACIWSDDDGSCETLSRRVDSKILSYKSLKQLSGQKFDQIISPLAEPPN